MATRTPDPVNLRVARVVHQPGPEPRQCPQRNRNVAERVAVLVPQPLNKRPHLQRWVGPSSHSLAYAIQSPSKQVSWRWAVDFYRAPGQHGASSSAFEGKPLRRSAPSLRPADAAVTADYHLLGVVPGSGKLPPAGDCLSYNLDLSRPRTEHRKHYRLAPRILEWLAESTPSPSVAAVSPAGAAAGSGCGCGINSRPYWEWLYDDVLLVRARRAVWRCSCVRASASGGQQ